MGIKFITIYWNWKSLMHLFWWLNDFALLIILTFYLLYLRQNQTLRVFRLINYHVVYLEKLWRIWHYNLSHASQITLFSKNIAFPFKMQNTKSLTFLFLIRYYVFGSLLRGSEALTNASRRVVTPALWNQPLKQNKNMVSK